MANPNPYAARRAKKRRYKQGDLQQLQRLLWHALLEAKAVLDRATEDEAELKLKAVHALGQVAAHYSRLVEATELEARLQALEQQTRGKA